MIRIGRGSGKWNMMMKEIRELINRDFTVSRTIDKQENLVLRYYMNDPYKGYIRGIDIYERIKK